MAMIVNFRNDLKNATFINFL